MWWSRAESNSRLAGWDLVIGIVAGRRDLLDQEINLGRPESGSRDRTQGRVPLCASGAWFACDSPLRQYSV